MIFFVKIVLIVAKCIVNLLNILRARHPDWSINSSKVYCKFILRVLYCPFFDSINSSKVYCKSAFFLLKFELIIVLIVAKCIVN